VRRRGIGARVAAAALIATGAGAVGSACAPRDLTVEVTNDGTDTLVTACETFPNACTKTAGMCDANKLLCDSTTCMLNDACQVGTNPQWNPELTMGVQLLLLQVTPDTVTVANQGTPRCVPLNLRRCIYDAKGVHGCETPVPDPKGCITDALAVAVGTALGSGLSFPGFTSTDGVALALAFYRKAGDEMSCDEMVLVNPTDCQVENLTAVAGLSDLSGGSTYDITCASCQNGTHAAFGPDNASCPSTAATDTTTGDCFLKRVAAAITAATR
jgi:hypothetical protein